jgi:uncharacterized protein
MQQPADLHDRDVEWADLAAFAGGDGPIRIGIVYGRRRQGKSWLLRRLVRSAGGVYTMALQHDRASALGRFATALAEVSALPGVRFELADWEEALRTARTVLAGIGQRILVLDEFPYLLEHSPELPSVLQAFHDEVRDSGGAPLRVLLCGSAISIMEELLSGTSPLRGRTHLEIRLQPFDFRTAAGFWRAAHPGIAFLVHAVLGGTPGYRDLADVRLPDDEAGFGKWLSQTVLNPASALFTEADYLLREDPRIQARAPYYAILDAVSRGASTPTAIGAAIQRDRTALSHPLGVLTTAGFLVAAADIRKQRGSSIRIADPVVRFHHLITRPRLSQFEERHFDAAWDAAGPTFRSGILGPHFEQLAREWVRLFAAAATLGGPAGAVGFTLVPDRQHGKTREVDVVVLAAGERSGRRDSRILALGEAKNSDAPRSLADLHRLERVRALLLADGADCAGARLLLFGRSGFDARLSAEAAARHDVELVDLDRIYRGE